MACKAREEKQEMIKHAWESLMAEIGSKGNKIGKFIGWRIEEDGDSW